MNQRDTSGRAVVEQALRTPGGACSSNNLLHSSLQVSIGTVREIRRRLESSADIPRVLLRRGRNGRLVDCSRVIDPPWLGRGAGFRIEPRAAGELAGSRAGDEVRSV